MTNKPERLTDARVNHYTESGAEYGYNRRDIRAMAIELQELRKADSAEPIYQYRIRNGYNGQVTEWQTIRRDQVDFVLKAQPLNAEFQIISAPQPAPVVPDNSTCKYCGGTGYFRWQQSANMMPCPCVGWQPPQDVNQPTE